MKMLHYNLIYSSIIMFIYLLITGRIFQILNLTYHGFTLLILSCKFMTKIEQKIIHTHYTYEKK